MQVFMCVHFYSVWLLNEVETTTLFFQLTYFPPITRISVTEILSVPDKNQLTVVNNFKVVNYSDLFEVVRSKDRLILCCDWLVTLRPTNEPLASILSG